MAYGKLRKADMKQINRELYRKLIKKRRANLKRTKHRFWQVDVH